MATRASTEGNDDDKRPTTEPNNGGAVTAKRARTDGNDDDDDDKPVVCLALPNLGPAEAVAASLEVLRECIGRFLEEEEPEQEGPQLEVMLVEEAAGKYATQLHALEAALPQGAGASRRRRFRLHLGQLTALQDETGGQHYAQALVVPCDHRLLPSDHPVASDTFQAAGPALASTAKLLFHKAQPTKAYPVKMVEASPLRATQGVEYVLLVMPPCPALATTLPEGWQGTLRKTYDTLLRAFVAQVAPKLTPRTKKNVAVPTPSAAAPAASASVEKDDDDDDGNHPPPSIPAYRHPGPPPQSTGWQGGLTQYLQHAAALKPFVFLETPSWMVIYDGYPKAKVHLLLLPKPSYLPVNGPADLRRDPHEARLLRLHAEGRRIQAKLEADMPGLRFRLGYHSIPSLQPLHLHLISEDFHSPALKTKKHWQSFTSAFFLDAAQVEAMLREQGRVTVDKVKAEALLKEPLRCHGCGGEQKNMPTLKQHLTQCRRVKEMNGQG